MGNLKKFLEDIDFSFKKHRLPIPNVSYVKDDSTVHYQKSDNYLTFKVLSETGFVCLSANGSPYDIKLEYSVDGGNTWEDYTVGDDIELQKGERETIKFRGINQKFSKNLSNYYNFEMVGVISASGSVNSLMNKTGNDRCIMQNGCFCCLFSGCTSLVNAPELPANILAEDCYNGMFSGCTALTSAPELPATTLAPGCYGGMFYDCTSLITAPVLQASILALGCYSGMFSGCTALTSAPELPATELVEGCYEDMFYGCTSLTTAPKLPATTLANYCYVYMFAGCTSLTESPELPATELVEGCYSYMFEGCTSLNYIKALFTTTPSDTYTESWVNSVSGTGVFVKSSDASWNVTGINGVPQNWNVDYDRILTLTAEQDNSTVILKKNGSPNSISIQYSTDGLNWSEYTIGDTITLTDSGDYVKLKGVNSNFSKGTNDYYRFLLTGKISASGDVTSLLNGRGGNNTLYSYCFLRLFNGCTALVKAPSLPSMTMVSYCYYNMFSGCTALETPPELPADRLSGGCYEFMFSGCTSLKTAPELPAMSLGGYCYKDMFRGCTSLVDPPELPATTLVLQSYFNMFVGCTSLRKAPVLHSTNLAKQCYDHMFQNCTSLKFAPVLPATTLTEYCYTGMFYGCTSLTTAPELPATTLERECYGNMFYGCTSLVTAPELPATTLANFCYSSMFYNCTSLVAAPVLHATTLATSCYSYMFRNCTVLTTAPELQAETLADNCYQGMFQGCTALTTAPELPATTLATFCYSSMFRDCTSLVTAPELPATTLANSCYSYMFYGCNSLVTAPELPATTLVSYCYGSMFQNCSNLNYIKAMFTTTPSNTYTNYWVSGVKPTGTFVKNPEATWNVTGTNGIPSGWTIDVDIDYDDIDYDKVLKFTAEQSNSTVKLLRQGSPSNIILKYSTDSGTNWNNYAIGNTITLANVGDTIGFIGLNSTFSSSESSYYYFQMTGRIAASGDVTSLLNCFGGDVSLTGKNYCFNGLFQNCTALTTAPELPATALADYCYSQMFYGCSALTSAPELPATTLTPYCYSSMFSGCTALTSAPELPATTLTQYCYERMFRSCTSLTTAPELPATTLTQYCYNGMFRNCTSLVNAPELPATTLATSCYQYMFRGCASLTTAPELPATTLASQCYNSMFYGCTSLTEFTELPATNLASGCYGGMFYGCTSLTIAPELPATTLTTNCYSNMFNGCTALTTAPELPAMMLTSNCYGNMFSGCTALTTAPELPATTLAQGCYNGMFFGCSNLNYIKALFTTTPSTTYTQNWVSGVKSTGTFVKNPEATWDVIGVNGVPQNWTVVNELKLTAQQANSTVKLSKQGSPAAISLEYSTNDGSTWNTYTVGNTITLNNIGDTVKFRGINSTFSSSSSNYYKFQMTGRIAASGDVTSLLNGTGGNVNLTGKNYCFYYMFYGCGSLTKAPNLPSMTLASQCYSSMFYGCTSLTTATELPATTLSPVCYYSMFRGCTSITTAPNLPATNLASGCYGGMFQGCTSLTTAPELPAMTLSDYCYGNMFYGCTSLVTAPELPATELVEDCYSYMFRGCTSLTTAPELPAKTLASNCYDNMFRGCTSLVTAPELPATTLVNYCYNSMFYGCTNLNYIKAMFTTTPSTTYTQNWVSGVAATGTFVKSSEATWTDTFGPNAIPSGWSVETYEPSGELIIYVDDFPDNLNYDPYPSYQDYLEAYVEDPEYFGSNKYRYTGETFEYDGDEYYLWEMMDTEYGHGNSSWNASVAYMLTETIDYNTLNRNSMYYDTSNRYIVGIEYLTEDMEDYTSCDDRATLVRVFKEGFSENMSIYVDEFPEDDPRWYDRFGNVDTIDEYLELYLDDLDYGGANKYDLTQETFSYDGNTYYVWEMDENFGSPSTYVQYAITNTTDFTTLYGRSIESDYENYTDKFIILLDEDMNVYREDCDALIKIEQN